MVIGDQASAAILSVDRVSVDRIVGRIQSETSPALGYYTNDSNNWVGATGGNPDRHDNNVIY